MLAATGSISANKSMRLMEVREEEEKFGRIDVVYRPPTEGLNPAGTLSSDTKKSVFASSPSFSCFKIA